MSDNVRKYPCPRCGYFMFDEPPGSHDICGICLWEDDIAQLRFPRMAWGPNRVNLIEAQRNYAHFGASEARVMPHVRPDTAADARDPEWRTLFESEDNIEVPVPGVGYGTTYPKLEALTRDA